MVWSVRGIEGTKNTGSQALRTCSCRNHFAPKAFPLTMKGPAFSSPINQQQLYMKTGIRRMIQFHFFLPVIPADMWLYTDRICKALKSPYAIRTCAVFWWAHSTQQPKCVGPCALFWFPYSMQTARVSTVALSSMRWPGSGLTGLVPTTPNPDLPGKSLQYVAKKTLSSTCWGGDCRGLS